MRIVLVVDDDSDLNESVAATLRDEGYEVVSATNGRTALSALESIHADCLILLDLMMPVMNGWQFRAAQKLHPRYSTFPVVVMSATPSLEQAAIDADALLAKPVQLDLLLDTVRRFAGERDGFDESAPTTKRSSPRDL